MPHAPFVPDRAERGAPREGSPQSLDRRLFMQLLAFAAKGELPACELGRALSATLARRGAGAILYEDLLHPAGLALLLFDEDPATLARLGRALVAEHAGSLRCRPELTMLGRTYGTGFEADLEERLLRRPRATVLDERWPWAIWYPLQRRRSFARLEGHEQGLLLQEHARIGRAYGEAGLAHDVRLACHGLDQNDNDFVVGLVGPELHPLSQLVQTMRSTRHTASYIAHMGPFFVGHAVWRQAPS